MPEITKAGDLVPPQNLEAEMALIGAVLIDREILAEVAPMLRPQQFYAHVHETLWEAIKQLFAEQRPVDLISLAEMLKRRGDLERIGGLSYLRELMRTVQTVRSAQYYAQIIREKALLRAAIALADKVRTIAYEGEEDVEDARARIGDEFMRFLENGGSGREPVTIRQAIVRYETRLRETEGLAFHTPWPALDKVTGGFTPDELVVWASDPGVGKSMVLNMLAVYLAVRYGHVAVFAGEMGEFKTTARFLALLSGVSARRQRQAADPKQNKPLTKSETDALKYAREYLEVLPIDIYDEAMSIDEIVSECRRLHARNPLCAVIIDTLGALTDLQGVEGGDRRGSERSTHDRQKRVAWLLKNRVAKSLQTVVHVAHHFSRGNRRPGERPHKGLLRDGGNLEGTATTIIFPHREEGEETDERTKRTKKVRRHMFIVEKARDGNDGAVLPMEPQPAKALWLEPGQDAPFFDPAPEQQQLIPEEDSLGPIPY